MLRQPPELLEHLEPLAPEAALLECVAEKTEERVRLSALLGLAERLRDVEERLDVARIALDLVHPERLEVVELLLLNQNTRIFAERHGEGIVCKVGRELVERRGFSPPGAREELRIKSKKPGFHPAFAANRQLPTAN
jgi:hypothetical protein